MDIESRENAIVATMKDLPRKLNANVAEGAEKVKKLGQDDPRRIFHSLKMGLALTLVSLIYYVRPLYDGFGVAGIWAVMTVVVVFEFTVGATISKCLNRGFATLLAGALGLLAQYLASLSGNEGKPILLGIFVFLLASASTFTRFLPNIKARYDYGILIFILTFSLVVTSGARVSEINELAYQRLSTIIIGASICLVISIFVSPVWAGEDLHKMVAVNLENLSKYIQGFGGEYFKERSTELSDDGEIKVLIHAYQTILNSKTTADNLASFARWEPPHGGFRLRHPWKKYLDILVLIRQCANSIEAPNYASINSVIKASTEYQAKIQQPCRKICLECSQALKILASAIREMTDLSSSSISLHLENSKNSAEDLKTILQSHTLDTKNLLATMRAATVASVLIETVTKIDMLAETVNKLALQAKFKSVEMREIPTKSQLGLHQGIAKPLSLEVGDVVLDVHEAPKPTVVTCPNLLASL